MGGALTSGALVSRLLRIITVTLTSAVSSGPKRLKHHLHTFSFHMAPSQCSQLFQVTAQPISITALCKWCSGCLVLEMLTGMHPWAGIDNQLAVVRDASHHMLTCSPEMPMPAQSASLEFRSGTSADETRSDLAC